jgi:hypothetical protein
MPDALLRSNALALNQEVAMKRTVFFVALALMSILVIAQAQDQQAPPMGPGCSLSRPAVNQKLFGHGFGTSFGPEDDAGCPPAGCLKGVIQAKAVGYPAPAQFFATFVYDAQPTAPDERCPDGWVPFNVLAIEWGETYGDNSLLKGFVDPGQVVCVNPSYPGPGQETFANITGTIVGLGRFEGATGTWSATVQTGGFLTGTLTVYCDN